MISAGQKLNPHKLNSHSGKNKERRKNLALALHTSILACGTITSFNRHRVLIKYRLKFIFVSFWLLFRSFILV